MHARTPVLLSICMYGLTPRLYGALQDLSLASPVHTHTGFWVLARSTQLQNIFSSASQMQEKETTYFCI